MRKEDFVSAIADKTGFTKKDINVVVDGVFAALADALVAGEDIGISGFGKFKVVERSARDTKNPQTGEPIHVPAKKAVKFTAFGALKDSIN